MSPPLPGESERGTLSAHRRVTIDGYFQPGRLTKLWCLCFLLGPHYMGMSHWTIGLGLYIQSSSPPQVSGCQDIMWLQVPNFCHMVYLSGMASLHSEWPLLHRHRCGLKGPNKETLKTWKNPKGFEATSQEPGVKASQKFSLNRCTQATRQDKLKVTWEAQTVRTPGSPGPGRWWRAGMFSRHLCGEDEGELACTLKKELGQKDRLQVGPFSFIKSKLK